MSDIATKACNVCGRLKQEVNHWLVAVIWKHDLTFFPSGVGRSESISGPFTLEDICGADCAHKRLSQWLTQQGI